LALPEEYSGRPRREWLTAAFERGGDAARVVAIFRDFISTHPELFSAANDNRARQVRCEKPTFTAAQVAHFYAEGRGRTFTAEQQKQRDALERQIIAAGAEGRIVR
jgi:hypothetical protein